jgi:hypothetical protein
MSFLKSAIETRDRTSLLFALGTCVPSFTPIGETHADTSIK